MKYFIVTFMFLTLFVTSYAATTTHLNSQSSAQASLEAKLLATNSLIGKFTQVTQDSNGNILQESLGKFELSRPGLFYWEVTQPYEQKIIVRNNHVIMLDPELQQATIKPLSSGVDQLPVLLLIGAGSHSGTNAVSKALGSFDITQDDQCYHLLSRTENSLVSSISLSFSPQGGPITQIRFINALDQTTIINFTQLSANQAVDSAVFHQVIPNGYDQIHSEE